MCTATARRIVLDADKLNCCYFEGFFRRFFCKAFIDIVNNKVVRSSGGTDTFQKHLTVCLLEG